MQSKTFVFASLAFATFASAHYDFVPSKQSGKIQVAGHDDEVNVDIPTFRVGGYDFGEVASDPYNVGDPGFNTQGSTSFTAGTALNLTALPVDGAFLRYWDGTGDVSFGAAPAGVTLSLAGSPSRRVTYSSSAASYTPATPATMLIANFSVGGATHTHLTSSIFQSGGQTLGSVPSGAYLLSFKLQNPGTTDSDPLFIVFNNGLDEDDHDASIDHVGMTYVPEPGCLGLLAGAGVLLRRKR